MFFFTIRIPFLGKEYVPEEASWVRAGQSVAATGFPWIYLGEQNPGQWANWKGPFFAWILGIAFKIFGESETVSRSVTLLFSLGQLILLYFLSKRIFPDKNWRAMGMIAMSIVALNPMAVQGSVQIDIDGGLVGFFVLLILYCAWPVVSNETEVHRKSWVVLWLASLFGFLVRFDTVIMIFFSLIVFSYFFYKRRRAFALVIFFLSVIIGSVVVLGAYNAAIGEFDKTLSPYYQTLHFTGSALSGKVGSSLERQSSPAMKIFDVFPNTDFGVFKTVAIALFPTAAFVTDMFLWLGIPFILLITFSVIRLIREKEVKNRGLLYISLPAAVILLAFTIVAPAFNFPRYIHSTFLLASIILGYAFVHWEVPLAKYRIWIIATILLTILLLNFSLLKVLLFEDRVRSNPIISGIAFLITALVSVLAGLWHKGIDTKKCMIFLMSIYIAFCIPLIARDIRKPYSLTAYYGNYGFKAAGEFLQKIAGPNDIVAAVDTIGFYYGRPYYDLQVNAAGIDKTPTLIAVYDVPPSRFAKFTEGKKLIAIFGTVNIYSSTLTPR